MCLQPRPLPLPKYFIFTWTLGGTYFETTHVNLLIGPPAPEGEMSYIYKIPSVYVCLYVTVAQP